MIKRTAAPLPRWQRGGFCASAPRYYMRFKQWIEATADEVLARIQRSPQFGDLDWERYRERWGVEGEFVEGMMKVADLVDLVNNFRIKLSKSLSQEDIESKVTSGQLNPVIITSPEDEPFAGVIVDGSHSLVAAHERGDETIDVIVSGDLAKWLGGKLA